MFSRLAFVVTLTCATPACLVSPQAAHDVGTLAAAAIWTAAIVGEISVLAYHDAHLHSDHCGHYRRYYDGRWVYYYGSHWEYYDDGAATWYFYQE